MMNPKVSVIVPNYNHAAFLQQRLESVLNQTFQDFELILLDDCSTDASRVILEGCRNNPHVSHIVYNENNSGSPFSQWKKGVELAQGEWVWIAESDDWAESDFLALMLEQAECHPKCGLLLSLPQYHFPDGSFWNKNADGSVVEFSGSEYASLNLPRANAIHNVSSILMRRSDVVQADLSLITSMRLCGDWMLYVQLCRFTDVLEINRVLSHYRIHGGNVTSQAEQEGIPLVEGVAVLDYLTSHFNIRPKSYGRSWGRTWAKSERKNHFDAKLREKISKLMRPYPSICLWHTIYRLRLCLK